MYPNRLDCCRKCGGLWISMRYIQRINMLQKVCTTCGYRWMEPPLDADEVRRNRRRRREDKPTTWANARSGA